MDSKRFGGKVRTQSLTNVVTVVRIIFLSRQIFVLPSTGFELTPLVHCSLQHQSLSLNKSSALCHSTTFAPWSNDNQ
jgi:hypothetical protein